MRYADGLVQEESTNMSLRRFMYRALAAFVGFVLVALPVRAFAATISQSGVITRKNPNTHPDQIIVNFISRSDCLQDDAFNFPLSISADGIGTQLEVWAAIGSTDCTDPVLRGGMNPQCVKVYSAPASMALQTATIRMQDIALVEKVGTTDVQADVQNKGTAAACDKTSGTAGDQITLFFLLVSSNTVQGKFLWPTTIDLLGPAPPTGVVGEGASTFIKLSWTINPDQDVKGYRFFCDPTPGAVSDAALDAPTVSADASTASCPDASAGAADASDDAADADDGADAGSSAVSDAGACSTSDAATAVTCGGNKGAFFVPNTLPSLDVQNRFLCGEVAGNATTSGKVEGFSSYQTVAVTVASFDQLKNVGQFAPVSCATTEPVYDFIDRYRQAGGTAGGGFCSMTTRPGGHGHREFLYGSLVLGIMLGLRRRRRHPSN
jgi:hypothetical protein